MADTTRSTDAGAPEETGSRPAEKSTSTRTAAKKPASTKTASKKTVSKKPSTSRSARSAPRKQALSGAQAALRGAGELAELTGKELEGVVGFNRDDSGWTVQVEVLEMRRIPATTDVLAVYDVTVDGDGHLVGYQRAERYVRGSAGEERR